MEITGDHLREAAAPKLSSRSRPSRRYIMSSPCKSLCRRPNLSDSWTKNAVNPIAVATHRGGRARIHPSVGARRWPEPSSAFPDIALGPLSATALRPHTPWPSAPNYSRAPPARHRTARTAGAERRLSRVSPEPARSSSSWASPARDKTTIRARCSPSIGRRVSRGLRRDLRTEVDHRADQSRCRAVHQTDAAVQSVRQRQLLLAQGTKPPTIPRSSRVLP